METVQVEKLLEQLRRKRAVVTAATDAIDAIADAIVAVRRAETEAAVDAAADAADRQKE